MFFLAARALKTVGRLRDRTPGRSVGSCDTRVTCVITRLITWKETAREELGNPARADVVSQL